MAVVPTSPATKLAVASGLALLFAANVAGGVRPAAAQGFFQSLFGIGTSAPAPGAPSVRAAPRSKPVVVRPERHIPVEGSYRPRRVAPEGSGSYTTVCVRMCDGFYFPVSHRVPSSRFNRDADVCATRCGESEARLFYHASGADMRSAVDLHGRSYARQKIAFLHRKQLVAGCACKPAPWSEAALIRHEGYALAEGRPLSGGSRGLGVATVVAGNYPDTPVQFTREGTETAPAETEPATVEPAGAASTVVAATTDAPSQSVVAAPAAADAAQPVRGGKNARMAASGRAPANQRPARASAAPAKPSMLAAPSRKPLTRVASAAPAGGGSKLVWPGDAPPRIR